jgi:hypothetical protein
MVGPIRPVPPIYPIPSDLPRKQPDLPTKHSRKDPPEEPPEEPQQPENGERGPGCLPFAIVIAGMAAYALYKILTER